MLVKNLSIGSVSVKEGDTANAAAFASLMRDPPAWLAVPPGVPEGGILHPSSPLRGMVRPVRFRVRLRGPR